MQRANDCLDPQSRTGATYFGCSVRKNQAGCDNARNVAAAEIESRVLAALRRRLLAPDVIAEAIEAYRLERQRLSREHVKARGSFERQLADVNRKIGWLMREIEEGRGSRNVGQRLKELETEQEALEQKLASTQASDIIELHPQVAERYRRKVEEIQTALSAGDAAGTEAVELVRDLIQRVRVIPTPRGEPVGLEIAGDLAAILNLNGGGQ
jgi:hypothetical protein